jgi:hypothetical protein
LRPVIYSLFDSEVFAQGSLGGTTLVAEANLLAGGADAPFFGMSAPLTCSSGAYIPTKTVGT